MAITQTTQCCIVYHLQIRFSNKCHKTCDRFPNLNHGWQNGGQTKILYLHGQTKEISTRSRPQCFWSSELKGTLCFTHKTSKIIKPPYNSEIYGAAEPVFKIWKQLIYFILTNNVGIEKVIVLKRTVNTGGILVILYWTNFNCLFFCTLDCITCFVSFAQSTWAMHLCTISYRIQQYFAHIVHCYQLSVVDALFNHHSNINAKKYTNPHQR